MLGYLLATSLLYVGLGFWLGLQATRARVAEISSAAVEPTLAPAATATLGEEFPLTTVAPVVEVVTENTAEELPLADLHAAVSEGVRIISPDLPTAWLELLADFPECQTFVEATAQVLRLEVGNYRDQLVELETRVRGLVAELLDSPTESPGVTPGTTATSGGTLSHRKTKEAYILWQKLLAELIQKNRDWLARLGESLAVLKLPEQLDDKLRVLGARLEDIIRQDIAQIESTSKNCQLLTSVQDPDEATRRLLQEVTRCLVLAHQMRDLMWETTCVLLVRQNRLQQLDIKHLRDDASGLWNRCGYEQQLQTWWNGDPQRQRTVSCVLFDVDFCGRLNEQWGTQLGDQVLAALGRILDGYLRKARGYDFTCRISGQRFLMVLPDTGPHGAMSAAERIRQTIAQSSFEHSHGAVTLTVTSGVTDILTTDDTESLFNRLQACLTLGRKLGRNQTILDEGAGPQKVQPPQYDVTAVQHTLK